MKGILVRALWLLGLTIVFAGLALLVVDPPRTEWNSIVITIPYTSYEVLYPGPHNFTRVYRIGGSSSEILLPGANISEIPINAGYTVNCSVAEFYPYIRGEGILKPVEDKYLNISLYILRDGSKLLFDRLSLPIRASRIPVTPTPATITSETFTRPSHDDTSRYIRVESVKGSVSAVLSKKPDGDIEVLIDTSGESVALPPNTTKLIVEVSSDASGELYLSSTIMQKCIMTIYLDEPSTIPRTSHEYQTIHEAYFQPGSLVASITLIVLGFAIMEASNAILIRQIRR